MHENRMLPLHTLGWFQPKINQAAWCRQMLVHLALYKKAFTRLPSNHFHCKFKGNNNNFFNFPQKSAWHLQTECYFFWLTGVNLMLIAFFYFKVFSFRATGSFYTASQVFICIWMLSWILRGFLLLCITNAFRIHTATYLLIWICT